MLHTNLHLERMADYCVTIAKLTKLVYGISPDPKLIEAFQEMGARDEEMIRAALDSFVEPRRGRGRDARRSRRARRPRQSRVVQHVLALGSNPALREWGLRMIIVSRCLERIGDHAVDIGEQTAYLVTGEFREFTDASHVDDDSSSNNSNT